MAFELRNQQTPHSQDRGMTDEDNGTTRLPTPAPTDANILAHERAMDQEEDEDSKEEKYEDIPEDSKKKVIQDGAWFTEAISKIDENWRDRWERLEGELETLKQAKAEGFESLETKQQRTATVYKQEFKDLRAQQARDAAKAQEDNERVRKVLDTVVGRQAELKNGRKLEG